jgi:hypothetical protein
MAFSPKALESLPGHAADAGKTPVFIITPGAVFFPSIRDEQTSRLS